MTVAIYVRLSQDVGLSRSAVKRQRADCEALCKAQGWSPVVVYEDNDVSAYSGKRRPSYQRLLDDIRVGAVERVVVWHPDRLHRSPRELEDFIDVIEASGCAVSTVTAGNYDLATPDGRLTARIVGSVARKESEDKSRRIRRKTLELAQAGAWVGGGTRPYGYAKVVGDDGRTTLEVVDVEAAEIVSMMERFLAGQSATSIAADLRARDVATVNGGQWRTNTVLGILCGGVTSGQREHLGEIIAAGTWPAIVTPAQTRNARAVAALTAAKISSGQRARTTYLLSGLCRCACGGRMHASSHSRGTAVAKCARPPNGCGAVSIRREPLEALVEELVLQAFDKAKLPSQTSKRSTATTERTIRDAEAQLGELAAAYADRVISMGEWQIARNRVQARLTEASNASAGDVVHDAAIRPFVGKPGALRKAWGPMTIGQKQAIVRAVIETITITAGVRGRNRFDPDRVDIRWRR